MFACMNLASCFWMDDSRTTCASLGPTKVSFTIPVHNKSKGLHASKKNWFGLESLPHSRCSIIPKEWTENILTQKFGNQIRFNIQIWLGQFPHASSTSTQPVVTCWWHHLAKGQHFHTLVNTGGYTTYGDRLCAHLVFMYGAKRHGLYNCVTDIGM